MYDKIFVTCHDKLTYFLCNCKDSIPNNIIIFIQANIEMKWICRREIKLQDWS